MSINSWLSSIFQESKLIPHSKNSSLPVPFFKIFPASWSNSPNFCFIKNEVFLAMTDPSEKVVLWKCIPEGMPLKRAKSPWRLFHRVRRLSCWKENDLVASEWFEFLSMAHLHHTYSWLLCTVRAGRTGRSRIDFGPTIYTSSTSCHDCLGFALKSVQSRLSRFFFRFSAVVGLSYWIHLRAS